MIGSDCIIYTRNHLFDKSDTPKCKQGFYNEEPVNIGNDVWVSGRVIYTTKYKY